MGGAITDDFTSIDLGYIYIHTCDLSSVGDDRGGGPRGAAAGATPRNHPCLGGAGTPETVGPGGG